MRHRCVLGASQLCAECVTGVNWVRHRCVLSASQVCAECVTGVCWVRHRCVLSASQVCAECVTGYTMLRTKMHVASPALDAPCALSLHKSPGRRMRHALRRRTVRRSHWRGLANPSGPFSTCPNCQIGDTYIPFGHFSLALGVNSR